jgi:hypothetical protein
MRYAAALILVAVSFVARNASDNASVDEQGFFIGLTNEKPISFENIFNRA